MLVCLRISNMMEAFIRLSVVDFTNILRAAFFTNFITKKTQTESTVKLSMTLLYENDARKMLMRMIPVHFNIITNFFLRIIHNT